MIPFATVWGELGGDTWTTQSAAVVVAAFIASLAAAVTAIVAIHQGGANREQERLLKAREHWWDRFKDVCDDLSSGVDEKKNLALVLFDKLQDHEWAAPEDRKMIVTVLAEANKTARKEVHSDHRV